MEDPSFMVDKRGRGADVACYFLHQTHKTYRLTRNMQNNVTQCSVCLLWKLLHDGHKALQLVHLLPIHVDIWDRGSVYPSGSWCLRSGANPSTSLYSHLLGTWGTCNILWVGGCSVAFLLRVDCEITLSQVLPKCPSTKYHYVRAIFRGGGYR